MCPLPEELDRIPPDAERRLLNGWQSSAAKVVGRSCQAKSSPSCFLKQQEVPGLLCVYKQMSMQLQ